MYFEETGAHQYKRNREMEANSASSSGDYGYQTEIAFSDDDPEQAVYADYDEQEL